MDDSRKSDHQSTVIAFLLWVVGAVILASVTWNWALPAELGVLIGFAYLAVLLWLPDRVRRYYDRQNWD
jgi:hypothetical protein